jgi:hypothetical protein
VAVLAGLGEEVRDFVQAVAVREVESRRGGMMWMPSAATWRDGAMRRSLVSVLLGLALMFAPATANASKHGVTTAPVTMGSLQLFATERAAKAHCPRDVVVWLNTNSGIYHDKGMRWYGNTKSGAYVCRREADAAGDRETRNGQ